MRFVANAALLVLALGCGSHSPPPATPDEIVEPPGTESAPADAPVASEASAGTSADAEAIRDALPAILTLVINDPELDQYLKLSEADRFPLKMAGELPESIELVKGNEPVQIVPVPDSKQAPVLVITKIEVDASAATVGYRYDVEGIRGTAYLKKAPYGWELSSSRIVEHRAR